jgi:hypothetical protein
VDRKPLDPMSKGLERERLAGAARAEEQEEHGAKLAGADESTAFGERCHRLSSCGSA